MDENHPPVREHEPNWAMTPDSELSPEPPARRPINWGLLILGFVTPFALYAASVALLSVQEQVSGVIAAIFFWVISALLPLFIVLFVVGRVQNRNGMRSYGLGGLSAFALIALLVLLAFGACLFSLPNY